MVKILLLLSALLILLAVIFAVIRFIKGPSVPDRLIAFDVMTIATLAFIALLARYAERIIYLDVAIVYGLLSFLGVIIVARYLEKGL